MAQPKTPKQALYNGISRARKHLANGEPDKADACLDRAVKSARKREAEEGEGTNA